MTLNFPSDIYAAQGLVNMMGPDYALNIVPTDRLLKISMKMLPLFFTEVDYKTGRRYETQNILAAQEKWECNLGFSTFSGSY